MSPEKCENPESVSLCESGQICVHPLPCPGNLSEVSRFLVTPSGLHSTLFAFSKGELIFHPSDRPKPAWLLCLPLSGAEPMPGHRFCAQEHSPGHFLSGNLHIHTGIISLVVIRKKSPFPRCFDAVFQEVLNFPIP